MWMRNAIVALCVGAASLMLPSRAQAAPITFTFDTSMLSPLAGVYSLDFQLVSPDYPSLTGNSATVSSVTFGGGSASGTSYYPANGGVSGSLTSLPLTLFVADFFNSVTADFVPGSMLSFALDLTNVGPAGAFPDQFSMAILLNGLELATSDPTGANKLLSVDLTGGSVSANQYALAVAPVPEPATWALLAFGLTAVAVRGRRRLRS